MEMIFWRDKKVFVTGHTGFKGSWLTLWLAQAGAKVSGYALAPNTEPSLFGAAGIDELCHSQIEDIGHLQALKSSLVAQQPEIIFHLAAQPLVRESYRNPLATYQTNVMGTLNLLEAARNLPGLKAIVVITTDKVYENFERHQGYHEKEPLGGYDPYSSSKACTEILTSSYYRSFFQGQGVGVATARAGNVIGGGDWAADRLIPDAIRSWYGNTPFVVRNPKATRPWQHVLEPLAGYLKLAEKLYLQPEKFSRPFNFGPEVHDQTTVLNVLERLKSRLGADFNWRFEESPVHEAQNLSLAIDQARALLGWTPKWNLDVAVGHTIDWYKEQRARASARELCLQQIGDYQK